MPGWTSICNALQAANEAAESLPGCDLEPGAAIISCSAPPETQSRVLRAYFVQKRVRKLKARAKGTAKQLLELERLAFAYPGNAVSVAVETIDLRGADVEVRLCAASGGAPLARGALGCCAGDTEQTVFRGNVGAYARQKKHANAAAFTDLALIDIELRPEKPDDIARWRDLLDAAPEKRALLYLRVQAAGSGTVIYCNEDDTLPETDEVEGVYLNRTGAHFVLSACPCNRDLRAEELALIRSRLAASEGIALPALFSYDNCPLPPADRSPQRLLEELNRVFRVYGIDTCLRRLHFLAQIYHESARFGTTLEGVSGDGYELGAHHEARPHGHLVKGDGRRYKGRGLMQLTWRDQQIKYIEHVSRTNPDWIPPEPVGALMDRSERYSELYIYRKRIVDNCGKVKTERVTEIVPADGAALISCDLRMACDSAGWYWRNIGHVTATNQDMNRVALTNNIVKVSQCINGAVMPKKINGLQERIKYVAALRTVLNFQFCAVNQ